MPQTGILRTWNEERGFGFIAPTGGGRELFVHISAFPRDGSRPTLGESLSYEPGQGADGRPQAVRVIRQAIGKPSTRPSARVPVHRSWGRPLAAWKLMIALVIAIGGYSFSKYGQFIPLRSAKPPSAATPEAVAADPPPASFRCDGRTHCSQMTSCREAKFFLKNCPDTKMDGNHDGVPCEQQWCTSPFAN